MKLHPSSPDFYSLLMKRKEYLNVSDLFANSSTSNEERSAIYSISENSNNSSSFINKNNENKSSPIKNNDENNALEASSMKNNELNTSPMKNNDENNELKAPPFYCICWNDCFNFSKFLY